MTHAQERFALDLVERFPALGENVDFYYDDPEDFLGHVYLGVEVTPRVVAAYIADPAGSSAGTLDWRGVLGFLEDELLLGEDDVKTAIGTSFLFRLPMPGEAGYAIVRELPSGLARLFTRARPDG